MAMTIFRLLAAIALAAATTIPAAAQGDGPGGGPSHTPPADTGGQLYEQICQACHMADARGDSQAGTIPALAGNPKLKDRRYPVDVVVRGRGGMPPFAGMLTKEQIAAVVNYVRTNFGNQYKDMVTMADIDRQWVEPSPGDH
jgi:mono/diheme cytochrome c family protein